LYTLSYIVFFTAYIIGIQNSLVTNMVRTVSLESLDAGEGIYFTYTRAQVSVVAALHLLLIDDQSSH
jgi:hypothetical protein